MGTQAAASMHRLTYTGPGDSTLFLTVQTYCGNNRLPDEWQELIPEISAVVIDVLVLACLLPLAEQTFNILLRHRNTRPSGLEWEGCGGQQPTTGTEIICEALASALLSGGRRNPVTHLRQFTQEEWDSFGVSNLTYDSYIKAGNGYYKPPARHTVGTHPQAHAPMYGPTHHPRIHGQFGCIYMLLFWVSALMWWVEVGRETARMQNGNRIYCGFALFMATPLIKPCLLALIALFGCLGCVMATPGLSVWKLFGGEESFEEILIRAQATPVESVKVCVRFMGNGAYVLGYLFGLPAGYFCIPMALGHAPTVFAILSGPLLLFLLFEIPINMLSHNGWLVRIEDRPHLTYFTFILAWQLVLLIVFSLHYSKCYHAGRRDYWPWKLQEQEFWSQVFKIPDLELAFSWPNRIPTHLQGVFGVNLILYVTQRCILQWLACFGKTVEAAQEATIEMTEAQTRANDSETIAQVYSV